MAGVEGLEPPAIGCGDRCSTNWNYTPKSVRYIFQLQFPCDVVFLEGSHQRHKGGRRIILMQASYTSAYQRLVAQCFKLVANFTVTCYSMHIREFFSLEVIERLTLNFKSSDEA